MQEIEAAPVRFPFATAPENSAVLQVADGIFWMRLRLPFALNHVNVYIIEDQGGFAIVDCGLDIAESRAAWEGLFTGLFSGKKITKVICTHYHPDHVGLAGWLSKKFEAPLYMPRTEFLTTLAIQHRAFVANRTFYEERGLAHDVTEIVTTRGLGYLKLVSELPSQFVALGDKDILRIGSRNFTVFTGGGHSPEQACLYEPRERLFLSADQVLSKISPNISVQAMEPKEDPLAQYLSSLARLRVEVDGDAVVLPGHHVPFTGVHTRIDELINHHHERCDMILRACAGGAKTATELVPVVFTRALDPQQMSFAFSEVVAHTNYLCGRKELIESAGTDGVLRLGILNS